VKDSNPAFSGCEFADHWLSPAFVMAGIAVRKTASLHSPMPGHTYYEGTARRAGCPNKSGHDDSQ
jgi:hypothetical protein